MSNCERVKPDLVAFDRGELSPDEDARVRAHVDSCPACARDVAKLRAAAALVARATAVEPRPEASARMRAALDAALLETQTAPEPAAAPIHDLAPRRGLRAIWDVARLRYEQSANFRRFTLASVGVHAAAAVVLALLLAESAGRPDRGVTVRVGSGGEVVTLPGDRIPDEGRTAALPPFEGATPEGVASPAAPGVVFPNRTTAERYGPVATPEGRTAALRIAIGSDAGRAQIAIDRGLDWLATQRGTDGAYDAGAPGVEATVEATAAAVLAFASEGRRSVDDPGLALSVAWLERKGEEGDLEDRALALRALTAQYVMDFARLPVPERVRRADTVSTLAAGIEAAALARSASAAHARDLGPSIAATVALADVRAAGLRDTGEALGRLVRSFEGRRTPDGRVSDGTSGDGVGLTAALTAVASDVGAPPLAESAVTALQGRIEGLAPTSNVDAARGVAALAALGRPVREPMLAVIARQRTDGRWTPVASVARAGRRGSAVLETAYGVRALARR